ncbi:MAG: hypothetical protein Q8S33_29480 [Myxococcales bacterium]|nr:hypothetical protein [Myxococcales bacterium]
MSRIDQVSVTTTMPRQSQKQEFGELLKNSLQQGAKAVGMVSGAVLQNMPGAGVVSAAVSAVTNFANQAPHSASAASSGVVNINRGAAAGGIVSGGGLANAATSGDMNGMVNEMRAEANRSMAMQMAMQQESREYNTISNVLKVRHDSAKAAINNIR